MEGHDEAGTSQHTIGFSAFLIRVDGSTQHIAQFPTYKLEAARLRTYNDWPKAMKQTPGQLSDAGFFYTKIGDRVVCFNCGMGLRAWDDEDDPWEEHAKFSPNCEYLTLVKGRAFVDEVQCKFLKVKTEKSIPTEHPQENQNEKGNEKCCNQFDEKLREWRLCKICFINEYNTVFIPCGHMIACAKCASSLTECPNCRNSFKDVIRIYFP